MEHVELVVDHLLVSLDVLLEDDLDGDLAGRAFSLANDAIGTGAEGSSESILCSMGLPSVIVLKLTHSRFTRNDLLFLVALGLAAQPVKHACDWILLAFLDPNLTRTIVPEKANVAD